MPDFSIESDLQRLEDWARDNVRRSKGTVSQTLRASALEFLKRMIAATPVDKGRAKAGWRAWLDDNGIFVPGDFGTGETLEQGRSEGSFREDLTGDQQFIEVVNGVPYIACVHGRTKVTVEGGVKAASAVRAGDMVLTQAGVYKPVRKVFSYKVPAGTDMVRLTSRWRKGKNHELLVTPHHKVLVYRGGRNKWVEAQDIQTTDALFQRRKISARKDTAEMATCEECGGPRRAALTWKFCSDTCRWVNWGKGNNWHTGQKRSDSARAKMSATRKRLLEERPDLHPMRRAYAETKPEREVAAFLGQLGVNFEKQVSVGRFVVDFMLPEQCLVVEADGSFWHKEQAEDVGRDREILERLGDGWRIIHIHFFQSGVSPQLEPQPLPGAHYVAVNPGPATYADPETFGRTEVRGVELFQTEKVGKAGPNKWTVYDFEVEDIHSYFANGMVVSNSLEFGHSKQAPAGFVRLNIRLLANDQKLGVKEIEKQIKDADRKAGFR